MDALRQETSAKIANIEARISQVDARIESVKSDLPRWMLAALNAQGGLIVAFVKLP